MKFNQIKIKRLRRRIITALSVSLFLTLCQQLTALHIPGVKGDGIHDDTEGIQALLDSRASTVRLPQPPKHYLISKTLKIHSYQTLIVDRYAVIRLTDYAHAHLLTNSDKVGGNIGITVIGGIWDGNNATQTSPYHQDRKNRFLPYDPDRYMGMLMHFDNVTDLHIADMTYKDPEQFGFWGGNLHRFTIENITFDYTYTLEPIESNPNPDAARWRVMCGVQIQGNSSHGRIANLKGTTYDDMVALNADSYPFEEIGKGPITDIHVDGIWSENGYRAVRLLSCESPIKRIKISNIFCKVIRDVVILSDPGFHPCSNSLYEDISISGVFCSNASENHKRPHIWIYAPANVSNLSISDCHRTETEQVSDVVYLEKGATIDRLSISNASLINHCDKNMTFVNNQGTIGVLHLSNIFMQSKNPNQVELVRNTGQIKLLSKTDVSVNGQSE